MYTQPIFDIPPEIEAGVLEGVYRIWGGIVREADSGRIVKHLKEITPSPEAVEQAVRKLNPKVVGVTLVVVTAVGTVTTIVVRRRSKARALAEAERLTPVSDFEASLRAYVQAGKEGALDAEVIERLIANLDALKALSEEGGDVAISFDDLVPLFELVIAHTRKLADAYDVELEDVGTEDDGVVVSLRRHLDAQKSILSQAS